MAKKKDNKLASEAATQDSNLVAVEELPAAEKIDFDAWHSSRAHAIPLQHRKEILKADFRARGLSNIETSEAFDEALEKYGLKLV
jgi:hypothetical protein